MNLLFIDSYDLSPLSSGGVNRVIYRMSGKLTEDYGVKCFLGFFNDIKSRPLAPFAGRIKLSRKFDENEFTQFIKDNGIDIIHINFLQKKNLKTVATIYRIANRMGVKVVYAFHMCPGFQSVAYGTFTMLAFRIRTKRNIKIELSNLTKTVFSKAISLISPLALRKSYRVPYLNCDRIVVLSDKYVSPYMRLAGANDRNKFCNIGNPLSFDDFLPVERIGEKRKEVLVVARFDEDTKRLSIVLKAWKELESDIRFKDWALTLVGEGRDMDFYRHLTERLRLERITFTGRQSPRPYYERASLFLMTSSAEGWPMALSEALQTGTVPIVMDTFGSLHDLVEDRVNGMIIKNDTSGKLLYEALCSMMSDPDRIKAMSIQAIELSHRYHIDTLAQKWMWLYRDLLQNGSLDLM